MSSKIVIFGSGGVGGYFGARLAAAGKNVTFVAEVHTSKLCGLMVFA
jgi:ketopantoate reductase